MTNNTKNKEEYGIFGDYQTWEEAKKDSTGYESKEVLEKTLKWTLDMKEGRVKLHPQSYHLFSFLLKAGLESNNKLNVLDFGGALGTHYFNNKALLPPIKLENWTIVEQENNVKIGKEKISDGILDFAYSIDDIKNPNLIIVSGALQYLEKPYEMIKKLIDKGADFIIIDRTSFNRDEKDRLTIQKVHPEIYNASFPCWFFNQSKFLELFKEKYELVIDFVDRFDRVNIPSIYKGFFFRKITK